MLFLHHLHKRQHSVFLFFLWSFNLISIKNCTHLQLFFFATTCDHTLHNPSTKQNELKRLPKAKFRYKLIVFKKRVIYAELAWIIHILHLTFVIQILFYANGKASERVLGRPQHTPLMNPTACFSPAVTHPGNRVRAHQRKLRKRILWKIRHIFTPSTREFTEDVHSSFFFSRGNLSSDCPDWVTVVRPQCLQLTESPQNRWI